MLGRTGGQTKKRKDYTNGTEHTDQPDETTRTGYTCIYGRKTRTDGQSGWTDKRTNWMNEPDGRTT